MGSYYTVKGIFLILKGLWRVGNLRLLGLVRAAGGQRGSGRLARIYSSEVRGFVCFLFRVCGVLELLLLGLVYKI